MMIRILFASAALLALAAPRPAAAETITWGSCVTNKKGSGLLVDIKFYKTTDITYAKVATDKGPQIQWTALNKPVFIEPSLASARSYCIGDGGTYVAVVQVKGGLVTQLLIDATAAAAGAAICAASAGGACVVGAAAVAGIAATTPAVGLFAIATLPPGKSLDVWGLATAPQGTLNSTAQSVICSQDYVGYACRKDNGDPGVCGMVSGITPSCQRN